MEMERPNRVVFFGVSRFHESTDTVTFELKPGHKDVVQVNYTTDIELIRWYRYASWAIMTKCTLHVLHGIDRNAYCWSDLSCDVGGSRHV